MEVESVEFDFGAQIIRKCYVVEGNLRPFM